MASSEKYVFPLTYSQAQLWYIYQLEPQSTVYNIPFAFRCKGILRADALQQAFELLIKKHEALRTNCQIVDGKPSQVIHGELAFTLQQVDLTADPARLDEVVEAEIRKPFVLETDPLMRASLLKLAEDDWVLLMSFHHIIIDHLSVLRVGRDLEEAYAAGLSGRAFDLEEDALQYADFTIWQKESLTDDVIESKLDFWREMLSGKQQILSLPTDRPRPRAQTFNGCELNVGFDADLSERVRRFAKDSNLSLFVLCLAGLNILLHRLSGQESVIVGCPFANRNQEELEDVVGLFMNLLPLAVVFEPGSTFADVADQVKKRMGACLTHQDTPFELIVNECMETRNPAYNPLLQVWYTFQEPPMNIQLQGVETHYMGLHNEGAKLDLAMWLWDAGTNIQGVFEFNTDLFEESTIQNFLERFEVVLDAVITAPDLPVSQLPLLTESDHSLYERLDSLETAEGRPFYLDVIDAQFRESADAKAILHADGEVTYSQLADIARKVLGHVQQLTSRGDIVAVALDRCLELPGVLLGILMSGRAYLPMETAFPKERLQYMLEDSGATLLIGNPGLASACAEITLAELMAGSATEPTDWPEPSELAYVIYTSGSTGKPKGVKVSHAALNNFLVSMAHTPGLAPSDRGLALTTMSFDISILELFLPFYCGASYYLAGRDESADGRLLMQCLSEQDVNFMQATPSTWRMLLDAGWQGNKDLCALCGGEALPSDLAVQLSGKVGKLWNMYGPTEATIWSTCGVIDPSATSVDIGLPIDGTLLRIVDSEMQLQPVGMPGELLIAGLGVAEGYINRDDLNVEKFVELDHGGRAQRFYRTGDLVKLTSTGRLVHLGRIDSQVKVRGFRIELEEIEVVLNGAHKDIQQAVVGTWSPKEGDVRLVAYLQSRTGQPVPTATLRKQLRQQLPDYMVPQHFVPIGNIPMTANNKVNRARLPAPDIVGQNANRLETPSTPTEEGLVAIWKSVLSLQNVSTHQNFFELGGHSLLAMQMSGQIEQQFGVRLAARAVVLESLADIARIIDEGKAETAGDTSRGILSRIFGR